MADYYLDKDWTANSGSEESSGRVGVSTRSRGLQKSKMTSKESHKAEVSESSQSSKKAEEKPKKKNGMSEYELMIQRNIEERKKLFEMLQLGDAKRDLNDVLAKPATAAIKRKADESDEMPGDAENKLQRKVKKIAHVDENSKPRKPYSVKKPDVPLQMALRERKNKALSYTESSLKHVEVPRKEKSTWNQLSENPPKLTMLTSRITRARQHQIDAMILESEAPPPPPITLSSTYAIQESLEESTGFVEDLNRYFRMEEARGEKGASCGDLQMDFLQLMKTFNVNSQDCARMSFSKIVSLAWHPNSSHLLLASGDKTGSVNFWEVGCQQDDAHRIRSYDVYSSPVTGLSFDNFNPLRLFSTCRDAEVRLLDFETGLFNQLLAAPVLSRGSYLTNHVQKDSSSLLVSRADGRVFVVDIRTPKSQGVKQRVRCFESSIQSLSLHPLDENLFMASSENKEVAIFDLRNMNNSSSGQLTESIVALPPRSTKLHGSLFSPLTGKYALTMGQNLFEIFDVQAPKDVPQSPMLSLDLSHIVKYYPLKHAMWHPHREDVFFVSGMNHPRRIEMFSAEDGRSLHTLQGDWLTHETGIGSFHPSVPILASVSERMGFVHLFRPASPAENEN